jgi:hypothetical protein
VRPPQDFSTRAQLNKTRSRTRNLERRFNAERFVPVVFDGLGSVLTTGVKGDVPIHFDALIVRWRLLADRAGGLVVDVWKTNYAGFPPTVGNTIAGSDLPTLAGAAKAESTALTGWNREVNAGDVLRFNIDSVSAIQRATLTLTMLT